MARYYIWTLALRWGLHFQIITQVHILAAENFMCLFYWYKMCMCLSHTYIHTHIHPQKSRNDIKQKLAFITSVIKDRNTIAPVQQFRGRFKWSVDLIFNDFPVRFQMSNLEYQAIGKTRSQIVFFFSSLMKRIYFYIHTQKRPMQIFVNTIWQ